MVDLSIMYNANGGLQPNMEHTYEATVPYSNMNLKKQASFVFYTWDIHIIFGIPWYVYVYVPSTLIMIAAI